jgi:hypothetical protein
LPEAALEDCAAEQLLADLTRQWSAKWFARQNMRPLGSITYRTPPEASADGAGWLVLDEDLAIAVPDASRIAIASAMLDRPIDDATLTDADRQTVGDLAAAGLDDLCRRLAEMFRLSGDARWSQLDSGLRPSIDRPRGCSIGVNGRTPLLQFVASTDLLITSIKSALIPPLSGSPLQPIASGLAAQSITVAAVLGRCQLTLADIADLSEGDVLVFDRDTHASLPLAIDGRTQGGRCSVEQSNDCLQLKLLEPPIR